MIVSRTRESLKVNSSMTASLLELAEELQGYVKQAALDGCPLHEVEVRIFDCVLGIGFAATEQFLKGQGNGDLGESVTSKTGQTLHRSSQPVLRPLRSVFGVHTIAAFVYAPGEHEGIALRPVDARLELPEGRGSYLYEEFSQYFCVDQAFGQSHKTMKRVLRHSASVDSLERINQRLGEQADAFFDELPTPPASEEGELLVFTGDGKGVPLVKEDAAMLPVFEQPERPGNRRMATLAGVYSIDRYVRTPEEVVAALFRDASRPRNHRRPKPRFKHIRGSFAKTYDEDTEDPLVVSSAFEAFAWAEGQVAARLQPGQILVRLMDGQPSQWDAADACLESAPPQRTVDILDILHVSQYTWRAAKVLHKTFEHCEAFARDRLLRILRGGVRGVIQGLRHMATTRKLRGKDLREINTVCGYFDKNSHRMRYDEYLRNGYPIATGVIEGACRHYVKDRMERSGMRWRLVPAQAMLNVRAVFLSSYWDDFHSWRIQREQRELHPHRQLIANYRPAPLAV
jgi:hypothetical protein